jgi:DNA-damage-inducible protein D
MEQRNDIIIFQDRKIRKIWHNEEWYFSIIDVIEILTDSKDPSNYWTMLKKRENQLSTICGKFKFLAPDGKMRPTDCANTEGVLRIAMSVPSPKAEPLKLWLAEQGKRTIDETNDPELLNERQAEYYKLKGYSDEWIAHRMQTIKTRKELTNEWKNRGITEHKDFSILTATIAKNTFGLTPSEHSQLKGLEKENLRDHMTPLELIFTALGEEVTRSLAVREDAKGFNENHEIAQKGGEEAGKAINRLEENTGLKVTSKDNYLIQIENTDKKSLKKG